MAVAAPVMIAMMVASTAISAYGAYRQGKAQEASAKYNQSVQLRNAELARQQGALQAQQQDRENRLRLGAIEAAAGKAGGGQAGSALDLLADASRQGELQKQQILFDTEVRAGNFQAGAALSGMEAKEAGAGAVLGAGSELLAGGAKIAGAF